MIQPIQLEVEYTKEALADLKQLPKKHALQIIKKIDRLKNGLHGDIKRLQNHDIAYRLRMGNYRVLFDLEGRKILVRKIKHRKDVYE